MANFHSRIRFTFSGESAMEDIIEALKREYATEQPPKNGEWQTGPIRWAETGKPVQMQSKLYEWADPKASDESIARTLAAKGNHEDTLRTVKQTRWTDVTFRHRAI